MRKLFIVAGVFIGAVLLAFLGIGVFLMLAPGTKLFGVQYVKAESTSSVDVTKTYNDILTGDIIIEAYGAPVTIEYSSSGSFEFSFVQKFNGFTKTNIEKPSLSISVDDDGNLVVKTTEFVKFIWGSNGSNYSLKCKIPASYTNKKLTVKCTNSSINLKTDEYATGVLSSADLSTKGKIKLAGSFTIGDFSVKKSQSSLTIPEAYTITNANISLAAKSTTIKSVVSGKINHTSKKGSLIFLSCNELNVSTTSGRVESTASGTSVVGNATIKTTTGKVVVQHVGGDLTVSTTSGKVYVGQNQKGSEAGSNGKVTISTKGGGVYLFGTYAATSNTVEISTTSGNVIIGDNSRSETEKQNCALATITNASITTKSGKVTIEKIINVTISTKSGNVTIGGFDNANITTTSGDVDVNASYLLSELVVKTGKNGNVKATNLTGSTQINAQGTITAKFKAVSGTVQIVGATKAIKVVLPNEITTENRDFWISSAKTNATIHVGAVSKQTKTYHTVDTIEALTLPYIKITSSSGKITAVSKQYE